MIKIIAALTLFLLCFQSREAATSQVMYRDSGETLADVAALTTDFVVVKKLEGYEIYLEKPIEIPGKAPEKYQELVDLYEIVKVIKSETIKPGQVIKVWTEPAYGYESMRAYYVDGESESPIINQYKPVHEPKDGDHLILMLNAKEPEKAVYSLRATEGLESLSDLEKVLKTPVEDKPLIPTQVK